MGRSNSWTQNVFVWGVLWTRVYTKITQKKKSTALWIKMLDECLMSNTAESVCLKVESVEFDWAVHKHTRNISDCWISFPGRQILMFWVGKMSYKIMGNTGRGQGFCRYTHHHTVLVWNDWKGLCYESIHCFFRKMWHVMPLRCNMTMPGL